MPNRAADHRLRESRTRAPRRPAVNMAWLLPLIDAVNVANARAIAVMNFRLTSPRGRCSRRNRGNGAIATRQRDAGAPAARRPWSSLTLHRRW